MPEPKAHTRSMTVFATSVADVPMDRFEVTIGDHSYLQIRLEPDGTISLFLRHYSSGDLKHRELPYADFFQKMATIINEK